MDEMVASLDVEAPPEAETPEQTASLLSAADAEYRHRRRESSIMCEVLDQFVKETDGECHQIEPSFSQLMELQPAGTPCSDDQQLHAYLQCSANGDPTADGNLMHPYYSQAQDGLGADGQFGCDPMGQVAAWAYEDQLYGQSQQQLCQQQHHQHQHHHPLAPPPPPPHRHPGEAYDPSSATGAGHLIDYQPIYGDPSLTAVSGYPTEMGAQSSYGFNANQYHYSQHLIPSEIPTTPTTAISSKSTSYVPANYTPPSVYHNVSQQQQHQQQQRQPQQQHQMQLHDHHQDQRSLSTPVTTTSTEDPVAEQYIGDFEYLADQDNSSEGKTYHLLDQRSFDRYDPYTNNPDEVSDGLSQQRHQPEPAAMTVHHTTENNTYFDWTGYQAAGTSSNETGCYGANNVPRVSENYDPTAEIGACLVGSGDDDDDDEEDGGGGDGVYEDDTELEDEQAGLAADSGNTLKPNRKSAPSNRSKSGSPSGPLARRPVLDILRRFILNRMESANSRLGVPSRSSAASTYSTVSTSDMTACCSQQSCESGSNNLATSSQQQAPSASPRPLRSSRRINSSETNKPSSTSSQLPQRSLVVQHYADPADDPNQEHQRSHHQNHIRRCHQAPGSLCSVGSSSSIHNGFSSADENHENRLSRGPIPMITRTSPSQSASPRALVVEHAPSSTSPCKNTSSNNSASQLVVENRKLRSRTIALSTRNTEEPAPRSVPPATATCYPSSYRRRSSYPSKAEPLAEDSNNNNNTNTVNNNTDPNNSNDTDEFDGIQTRASKRRRLNSQISQSSTSQNCPPNSTSCSVISSAIGSEV